MGKKPYFTKHTKIDGRRRYLRRFWGGFVDNRLDQIEVDTGWGGFGSGDGMRTMPAIFTNRKSARLCYEDVRPIEAREFYR